LKTGINARPNFFSTIFAERGIATGTNVCRLSVGMMFTLHLNLMTSYERFGNIPLHPKKYYKISMFSQEKTINAFIVYEFPF